MIQGTLQKAPGLMIGLAVLLGNAVAQYGIFLLSPPIVFFFLFLWPLRKWFWLCLGILVLTITYSHWTLSTGPLPPDSSKRELTAYLSNVKEESGLFGPRWVYYGELRSWSDENGAQVHTTLPCILSAPRSLERFELDRLYQFNTSLKVTREGRFCQILLTKRSPVTPLEKHWGLGELRYHCKSAVKRYLKNVMPHPNSRQFITGLITGDFENQEMGREFQRFGLQHLMAISGFHFAIVAASLSFLLRLFFPFKKAVILVIFLLLAYFLFLGTSPSIMRAFLMGLIALCGALLGRESNSLNSLGFALAAILIYDPRMLHHLGFQFSFLTTASILLFTAPVEHFLETIWPKRELHTLLEMDRLDQHGYCLLGLFRQGMALMIAVNVVAIPTTLFHFHVFPILSLVYNLFYPFLVSIAILMVIFGIAMSPIPPLSHFIHQVNSAYTYYLLEGAYRLPTTLDFKLSTPFFPYWVLLGVLMGWLYLGLRLKNPLTWKFV